MTGTWRRYVAINWICHLMCNFHLIPYFSIAHTALTESCPFHVSQPFWVIIKWCCWCWCCCHCAAILHSHNNIMFVAHMDCCCSGKKLYFICDLICSRTLNIGHIKWQHYVETVIGQSKDLKWEMNETRDECIEWYTQTHTHFIIK